MSRFPSHVCSATVLSLLTIFTGGCMYQQPMYQPGAYGQQMYGAPGGYVQPGTMVIPPSNGNPYPPAGTNTYDSNTRPDDFNAEKGTSGESGGKFFGEDGGVPNPKDSGTGDQQFNRDLGQ